MPDSTTNGNERVTLAIIKGEILHLRSDIKGMDARLCAKLGDHEERIRGLERSSLRGDIVAYVAAVVGSVSAAIFGSR